MFSSQLSQSLSSLTTPSLSRIVESQIASGNHDGAIELVSDLLTKYEKSYQPMSRNVLLTTAQLLFVAVATGQENVVTNTHIDRLEQSLQIARTRFSRDTVFTTTALLNYMTNVAPFKGSEREHSVLTELASIFPKTPIEPELKELTFRICMNSSINLLQSKSVNHEAAESAFNNASNLLSKYRPSLNIYYHGLKEWCLNNDQKAESIFDQGLARVEGDIKTHHETTITKALLMEGKVQALIGQHEVRKAEQEAYKLLAYIRDLKTTNAEHLEIDRRCRYYLAEIELNEGNPKIARAFLKDLPRALGELSDNALALRLKLSE